MKCIEIQDQKLVLTERPSPKIKSTEILVKVHAAGVNRPDILQRKGVYPPPAGVTDIPGLEIAGEVVQLGWKAHGFKKGQKVCALVSGGGYAEFCAVPATQCLPLPKGMDFTMAAGIPETYFTAWVNLFGSGDYQGAQLKKDETILIHGGASGIGTTAIQMARNCGAKVFVTAGSKGKCKACEKLGAHMAIDYKTEDFLAIIMKKTKERGVDVVLDMIGGDYLPRNLRALAPNGRHVSIAMQRARVAELDILEVMARRLILTGSTLRPRSVEEKAEIAEALLKNIWPLLHRKSGLSALFSKKRLTPVIDKVFPFAEAQAAHDYLDSGAHIGKVILQVS